MAAAKQSGTDTYKLSLIGPGLKLNEHVSKAVAGRIVRLAMGLTGQEEDQSPLDENAQPAGGDFGTAKQFLAAKKPQSDVERMTALAYYLTYARKQPHFKTKDLTKLNTDAAGPRLSNPSVAARNAVNARLLALAGKGNKQISPIGEDAVKAMPDREKLKTVLAAAPKRRRRKTRTKKSR
jgi:hypothetical protein